MSSVATAPLPGRAERPSLSGQAPGKPPLSPYFKFDKALCDALLRTLSGVDLKVALAIERHTTGHYAQPNAEIAVSLLASWTGCSKNAALKARRRLIERGVVIEVCPPTNRRAARLELNRDTQSWGAYSEAPDLPADRCNQNAPLGPRACTPRGTDSLPPEVSGDYPLNGLNGLEELSELGSSPAELPKGSSGEDLVGFYEALEDAPESLLARLRRRDLVPGQPPPVHTPADTDPSRRKETSP